MSTPLLPALTGRCRHPAECLLLLGLIVALPLVETPKNLFWLAFILTWLFNRVRERDFGGPWDPWDSLIVVWMASGYLVAAFAGLHSSEWFGASDIVRFGTIFWAVKRSGYGADTLKALLGAVLLSTALALGVAVWELRVTGARHLELHSVGHVNHSAIYMAISYGLFFAALAAFWRHLSTARRLLGLAGLLAFFVAVVYSESMAAVGMSVAVTVGLCVIWLRRTRLVLLAGIVLLSGLGGYTAVQKTGFAQKFEQRSVHNNVLSGRDRIWNTGLEAWRQHPWFGVGMDNYNQITPAQAQRWIEAGGGRFDPARFLPSSHAHSLYVGTLAERGIFGLGVILLVLAAWGWALLRHLPTQRDTDLTWALWGGAFSAWLVTAGVGLVNTTLHHEHGILATLLLGFWLAGRGPARAAA